MKILLFGKNGQIGRELQRTLLPLGALIALGRHDVNLENLGSLQDAMHRHAPDIIVNAAGYTAVDAAESDEASAHRINAEAVGVMAQYASKNAALLVHYSTDYVFDGEKIGAYVEGDAVNPQNAYGRSKRAGEVAIQQCGCNALIFRTSWVFSAQGRNFIKTILRHARERRSIDVVADQHGAPTSAELIADVTMLAIFGYQNRRITGGVFHLAAAGETSWYGLACHVIEESLARGVKLALRPPEIHPTSSVALRLPAKRPANSRMDTSALSNALGLHLPEWRIHVDRVIDQLSQNEAIV